MKDHDERLFEIRPAEMLADKMNPGDLGSLVTSHVGRLTEPGMVVVDIAGLPRLYARTMPGGYLSPIARERALDILSSEIRDLYETLADRGYELIVRGRL